MSALRRIAGARELTVKIDVYRTGNVTGAVVRAAVRPIKAPSHVEDHGPLPGAASGIEDAREFVGGDEQVRAFWHTTTLLGVPLRGAMRWSHEKARGDMRTLGGQRGVTAEGSYAPPLGLEPRTCRLTAGCSAN